MISVSKAHSLANPNRIGQPDDVDEAVVKGDENRPELASYKKNDQDQRRK